MFKYTLPKYIAEKAGFKGKVKLMDEIAKSCGVERVTVYRTVYIPKDSPSRGNIKVLQWFHRRMVGGKFSPDDLLE